MISLSENNCVDQVQSQINVQVRVLVWSQIRNQVAAQVRCQVYWISIDLVGNEVRTQALSKIDN